MPGRRLYIDWSPTSQEEPHAVYNLHYVLALQRAGQLARMQGLEEDAGRWQRQASKLQAVIRQAFYKDDDRISGSFPPGLNG